MTNGCGLRAARADARLAGSSSGATQWQRGGVVRGAGTPLLSSFRSCWTITDPNPTGLKAASRGTDKTVEGTAARQVQHTCCTRRAAPAPWQSSRRTHALVVTHALLSSQMDILTRICRATHPDLLNHDRYPEVVAPAAQRSAQ